MRDRVRLLFVLVLVSLCFLTIGCFLDNDDDDDQSWPATGAIKLSAVADAGAGSFAAASMRGATVAEIRAAAARRFKGCVKIGAAPAKFFDLDLSDDNKKLTLAATLDGVSSGKQQVTIEIVASGVADAEPILKTIATATVAAGSTNEDSIKEAPINYETTAKAIAYETWQASDSKSIDDFTPDPNAINTLATTIKNTLGGTIDGTKTLKDQTIVDKAKEAADSAENISLVSISLRPISDSVLTNATFNLAGVIVTASYSNSSTKAVTGHTWSVTSGGGSLSGSTYTPPTTAGTAVLTCTFIENGITKTATLTVSITAAAPTLNSISINPDTGSVATNGTFDLAAIVVTATYSDDSTKTATGHTWSITSGGGSLSGSTYTPPTTAGTAVLTCSFVENGVTVTANLTLTVTVVSTAIELVNVPAGTFQRDATAANTSYVSAFRMSKHEITRAQFLAIMGTDPSDTSYSSGVTDPVQMVAWYHALVFCNKLSVSEGLTPAYSINSSTDPADWGVIPDYPSITWNGVICSWSADGYRLPTEMEWMWAAMGADSGSLGATNTTGYLKAFAGSTGSNLLGDYVWYAGNSSEKTHPAGSKLKNELGLFDISGNVKEWCWDFYDNVYPSDTLSDCRGPETDRFGYRVMRGGCFVNTSEWQTIAYRDFQTPYTAGRLNGFRVVRP